MLEPSTWRGIISLLTVFGVRVAPDQADAILTAGVSVYSAINIFRKEKPEMDKMVDAIISQGPLAAAMGIAIWWLASKIKDCEIDRSKLWEKVSELAERVGGERH